jgi:hypothetical protein
MTTRYVDFLSGSDANDGLTKATAWKRCKGMAGVTGAAAAASIIGGDTIVFKKGVTWTSSFPWNAVGGSSSMVTYTTEEGFGTGAQPVFDYQGLAANGNGNGILNGASWTTLNDLKFVNASLAGSITQLNSVKALYYENTHDVAITNCTFSPECWIAIYFYFAAGSYSNFTWTGNDFSHTGSAVWFATDQDATMHAIYYVGNTIHDFSSQIGNDGNIAHDGVHGDGFFHYFSTPNTNANAYIDGMTFANNRAYGDFRRGYGNVGGMTAFFFTEGSCSVDIFNNDFSYDPAQSNMFESLITLGHSSNAHSATVRILNNSFAAIGTNAMSCGLLLQHWVGTLVLKNNAIYSPLTVFWIFDAETTACLTSNKNLLTGTNGQIGHLNNAGDSLYKTYAQWQGLGFDADSIFGGDPGWVAAPGNERLSSGSSPAVSHGENLSSLGIALLNSDRDGVARGSSWDIGAYQYAAAASGTPSGHAGRGMAFFN